MLTLTAGSIHSAWTSPFIPELKSENSPIGVSLTTLQSSEVVSIYFVGYFVGGVISLNTIDIIGRKKVFIIAGVLDLIAWIFIYFSNGLAMLIVARIFAGTGTVLSITGAITYNGEISDKDNRGQMGYLLVIFNILGTIFGYVVGPYTSYGTFAILSASISIFATVCTLFIPESPYYLVKRERREEAERVVHKLSCQPDDEEYVRDKMTEIITTVEADMLNKSTVYELLFSGKYKKALGIHLSSGYLVYLSGNSTIKSYLQTILDQTGSDIPSSTSSLVFGIFNLLAALLSGQLVDRFGRKPLLILSSSLSFLSMFILATYFYFARKTSLNMDVVSWLPLTSLVIFEVFVAFGIVPISSVIGSELYPMNVKGIAISTVASLMTPVVVLLQLTFEPFNEFWGPYTTFWIYSGFCLLGVFFGIFILPETKGKTFYEIQRIILKIEYK